MTRTAQPDRLLNVLVVDDSAVVRQVMSDVLSAEGSFRVATAADPIVAEMKIRAEAPDVIVLDLEMPRMDGLTFLRKLMRENPIPVVICSGWAQSGTAAALSALKEGAAEIVSKPRIGVREFLQESVVLLSDAIRAAVAARNTVLIRKREASRPQLAPVRTRPLRRQNGIIAVAASTGGPEALEQFLQSMDGDAPGIVIVQHMPARFTASFAARLNEVCRIEVHEARDGDVVRPGTALIAPGDRHMELAAAGADFLVHISNGPLVSRHRPSADVLFHSVARVAGRKAAGILMTGMGDDGADGLLHMRQAGAFTVAQDESTCVVFGMPKEAIDRGAACLVARLDQLAAVALKYFEEDRQAAAPAQVRSIQQIG